MSLVSFLAVTVSVRAEEPAVSGTVAESVFSDAASPSDAATPSEAAPSGASSTRLTGEWLRFRQLIDVHLRTPREETPVEKKVYSYVQVPWSIYHDVRWTGSWNGIEAGGQKFSSFGCGICSLSNLYSTLTGEAVTPYTMFEWCKAYSNYHPIAGRGAIDWKDLSQMCGHFGFDTETLRKPSDYETFQKHVRQSKAVLALVCKDNDDKLWWYTNGHYISFYDYHSKDDTVFVADSSGLQNRQRVALKDIYNALKTHSDAQYLIVRSTNK